MNTICKMALIVFVLVSASPYSARTTELSTSDTNRNTTNEPAAPPNKHDVIVRSYHVLPWTAAIFNGNETRTNVTPAIQSENAKKIFLESGILFPEGTSLIYKPTLNLLIVSNTADNLARIERILSALNKSPACIEVEVRFVEIEQKALENINAQWMIVSGPTNMSNQQKTNKTGNNTPSSHVATSGGGAIAPGISSILTEPQMSFIQHALAQRDGVNLLSAPKVTTLSGKNAEIKVVQEIIYPTEFEAQVAVLDKKSGMIRLLSSNETTSASNRVMTAVGISKFETRDTGVILNVMPTVDPDGKTIHLTMNPQVVELAEWIDYGTSTMKYADGSSQQVKMLQPVFHSRSLASQISIWNGQTVVMGGLITEGQVNTEDKIPILGDIPLLGYLFRSKTTQSRKVNLLIFVTANLVDPAGKPIHRDSLKK